MLILSPVAVKVVARFVYGLGRLYGSFCLSAESERLTSCKQSQVVTYGDCVQLVIMLNWYISVLLLLIAFMSSARCLSEKYHRKLSQSMSGCHTVSRIDEGAGVDGQHPDEKEVQRCHSPELHRFWKVTTVDQSS
ncbi:hypothetical protein Anapl_10586 [Anas platyrhynchos]|uniref:Uncharacterized protein n=1 Tax=Anas platyrhynchos TaxID=8839 RepID=R0KG18_ANAPL|nr:hypothetical protein Anapl_10586 [Anas platyrhynchos]